MIQEEPIVEEEEEELHWSKKPEADPEAVVEYEELSTRLKRAMAARQTMPRRQVIRMVTVAFMVIFNAYMLYMSIGHRFAAYTFVYCALSITVCLDDLSLARKLREIRKGETKE